MKDRLTSSLTRAILEVQRPQLELAKAAIEKAVPSMQRPVFEAARAAVEQLQEQRTAEMRAIMEGFGQVLTACQEILWQRSWMVDSDCPLVAIVKGAEVPDGDRDVSKLDAWMLEYFEERREQHESFLLQSWPAREAALQDAFALYQEGRHRPAILTLLPLIEYVSFERTGTKFFEQRDMKGGGRVSRTYLRLVGQSGKIDRILQVLAKYSPMYCGEQDAIPQIINRHSAIHGRDDSFGTEMNYFRCISVLVFLTRYLGPMEVKK